jgi:hypothetical protein
VSFNAAKIRLGAPDSIVLTAGSTVINLGGTEGGCDLTYNPTNFEILIDQTLAPIAAYKTKEELMFSCALAQFQIDLINMAFAYAASNVHTISGTPNEDYAYFGSSVFTFGGSLDVTVPKNDGTTNHLIIHLNKVYSAKTIKFAFYREKNTSLDRVEFHCLADLNQPQGQQLGYIAEQY